MGGADTLEELGGLGDDVVAGTVGVDAVENVLDEGRVGAVAGGVGVVLAAGREQPGAQALRDDIRARKGLNGASGDGGRGLGDRRGNRLLGRGTLGRLLDGLGGTRSVDDGLGDGADGGGEGNRGGDNDGSARLGGAVGDLRSARGDGLDTGGVDGGGGVVDSGLGLRDGRSGNRLDGLGDTRLSGGDSLGGLSAVGGDGGRRQLSGGGLLNGLGDGLNRLGDRLNGLGLGGLAGGRKLGRGGLADGLCDRLDRLGDGLGGLGDGGNNSSARLGRDGNGRKLGGGGLLDAGGVSGLGALLNLGDGGGEDGLGESSAQSGSGRQDSAGLGLGRDRGLGRAAVEADGVDADAASGLGLGRLGGVDDGDVLGTTALGVLDGGSGLGAGRAVLAGRAVRHVVVELEVAVELDAHIEVADGELVGGAGARAAAERGRGLLLLTARALNDLAAEGAGSEGVTLGEVASAGPALEVESAVAAEGTSVEITPGEARLLLVVTLVVGVVGAVEGGELVPAL